MPLDIKHVSLAELFSKPVPLQMARYQRHYEWGRREMEQLLDDLDDAFAMSQAEPGGSSFHFLGNVIMFNSEAGGLEVVDGQQRLTSLTLIFAMARRLCDHGDIQTRLADLLFIAAPSASTAPAQPRLQLHRGDNTSLLQLIFRQLSPETQPEDATTFAHSAGALRANSEMAASYLLTLMPQERADYVRFISENGRFVEILVQNEDDAFRIFETVNNRGRPITSEDVLRYALVEFATDDMAKRDELLARWDAMEAELGPRGMKRFISGWRSRVAKGNRLRQSLHRTVLSSFGTPAEALTFLERELTRDIAIFRQIETADTVIADPLHKARIDTILQSLELVDFDEWLPLASELISKGATEPEKLANDLARVERLAWYYYLHRDNKGVYLDRRDRFATLMKIASRAGTLEELRPRALLSAEDRAKMRDLVLGRIDPKWVPLRSLLARLEMALVGPGRRVVRGDLTIEHILPLRPKAKAWLSLYDDSLKVVTDYAERIGNFCLVSQEMNTRLGNQTYANKRALLLEHGVPQASPLAADIERETQWTRAVIERRSKWLFGLYCETFQIHAHSR